MKVTFNMDEIMPHLHLTMADLEPGQLGRISRVLAAGAVQSRLLALGVLPGTIVELLRVAPTGDPVWVRLLGTQVALRKNEARLVWMTAVQG